MKKILLITYYWPPSGGAGVQRWVKLSYYLAEIGVDVTVITVDPETSSYNVWDKELVNEVHPKVSVHTTNSFEPINVFSRIFGKKNVPKSGFISTGRKSLLMKLSLFIRSNIFIPDPRIGWNRFAYKKAIELIKVNNFDAIVTTSPPHSTQLIGLKLKRKYNLKWIADLRDPWTDIFYYDELYHTKLSDKINKKFEKNVIEKADELIVVGPTMKNLISLKTQRKNLHVVTNGYDPRDFDKKQIKHQNGYHITYTGTMSDLYKPLVLIDQIDAVAKANEDKTIYLNIVGTVSQNIKEYILSKNYIKSQFYGLVGHKEVNQFQLNADLLLLVIPKYKDSKLILTGKIFEYIATRNRILNIGPIDGDAAEILKKAGLGNTYDHEDSRGIFEQLTKELSLTKPHELNNSNDDFIKSLSRHVQARIIYEIIKDKE